MYHEPGLILCHDDSTGNGSALVYILQALEEVPNRMPCTGGIAGFETLGSKLAETVCGLM